MCLVLGYSSTLSADRCCTVPFLVRKAEAAVSTHTLVGATVAAVANTSLPVPHRRRENTCQGSKRRWVIGSPQGLSYCYTPSCSLTKPLVLFFWIGLGGTWHRGTGMLLMWLQYPRWVTTVLRIRFLWTLRNEASIKQSVTLTAYWSKSEDAWMKAKWIPRPPYHVCGIRSNTPATTLWSTWEGCTIRNWWTERGKSSSWPDYVQGDGLLRPSRLLVNGKCRKVQSSKPRLLQFISASLGQLQQLIAAHTALVTHWNC